MLELTSIPTQNPDVIGRTVDKETVLVIPQRGQVKVLNEVGGEIWELTDGKRTIAEIAEQICTQFAVDQNTAQADTLKFYTELFEREIVFFIPS
jgi:hypothetical protein